MAKFVRAILDMRRGVSAEFRPQPGAMDPRSYNWLPDNRGYIRSYKGDVGVVTGLDGYVAAGASFVDVLGRTQTVVLSGASIYKIEGKTATKLYTYSATQVDGTILVHQNNAIFLVDGFHPMRWNGDEPVTTLGVREVPPPPRVNIVPIGPLAVGYFSSEASWGTKAYDRSASPKKYYAPLPMLQDRDPSTHLDATYAYRVAYMNSRGQIGRWSAPTTATLAPVDDLGATDDTHSSFRYVTVEWERPPATEPGTDLTNVVLARTVNLGPHPSEIEKADYYVIGIFPYTQNRTTDQVAVPQTAVEFDNYPPPAATLGTVYKDTLFLSGVPDDPYGVWWSKAGYMESFPPLNYHKASGKVQAIHALSDRVIVVTDKSVEVLAAQGGSVSLIRKEENRWSTYGRSLVVHKDVVYGLWNTGPGAYDGFQFKGSADIFGEFFDYVSTQYLHGCLDADGRYHLIGFTESDQKVDLVHDFVTGSWYRLNAGYYSMFVVDGVTYVGSPGFVAQWDTGNGGAAKLFLRHDTIADKGAELRSKTANKVWLVLNSTADNEYTITLRGDADTTPPSGKVRMLVGDPPEQTWSYVPSWDDAVWDNTTWASPSRGQARVLALSGEARFFRTLEVEIKAPTYAELVSVFIEYEVADSMESEA